VDLRPREGPVPGSPPRKAKRANLVLEGPFPDRLVQGARKVGIWEIGISGDRGAGARGQAPIGLHASSNAAPGPRARHHHRCESDQRDGPPSRFVGDERATVGAAAGAPDLQAGRFSIRVLRVCHVEGAARRGLRSISTIFRLVDPSSMASRPRAPWPQWPARRAWWGMISGSKPGEGPNPARIQLGPASRGVAAWARIDAQRKQQRASGHCSAHPVFQGKQARSALEDEAEAAGFHARRPAARSIVMRAAGDRAREARAMRLKASVGDLAAGPNGARRSRTKLTGARPSKRHVLHRRETRGPSRGQGPKALGHPARGPDRAGPVVGPGGPWAG